MPRVPFARDPNSTFPFVLARELGMTVGELMSRMDHGEYVRWRAFYKYESVMADMRKGGGGPIG